MANGDSEPFVRHLLAQHQRLDAMLREASSDVVQCRSPDADASSKDIELVLRQVRDELARHFAEEEAGGCLEEAVTRCPHLSAEELRIESEHAELLGRIERLIHRVATAFESNQDRNAFEIDFRDFCRRVHAHELAENELIRQAFGAELDLESCAAKMEVLDF